MHPYMNEDVAFERMKDLQREMDNSRLMADSLSSLVAGSLSSLVALARNLAARAWSLGGQAMRRAPRRHPVRVQQSCEEGAASDAA